MAQIAACFGNEGDELKQRDYTKGSLYLALLSFAGPFLLSTLLQNLYGTVDLFLVGRFATTVDISAVSTGGQLMFMATQFVIGLSTSIIVLVGNQYGAGQKRELSYTLGSAITLFAVVGVALTTAMLCANHLLISLMSVPPQAVQAARDYLFYCTLGVPFLMGYNVVAGVWLGQGHTRLCFFCTGAACVTNILLDLLFIKGFGMGAAGAAIAICVKFALSLILMRRVGLGFSFVPRDMRAPWRRIWKLIQIGGPLAAQNVLISLSFSLIIAVVNQRGVVYSAAAGVAEKVFGFLIIPTTSFAAAVATVSSQNIGAGQLGRSRKSMWNGVQMALVPSVLAYLLCFFSGTAVPALFSSDAQVNTLAAEYIRSNTLDCMLLSIVSCCNAYFNSCGYSWFTMAHSLFATFACRVPLVLLISGWSGFSMSAIGLAPPISTVVSIILCMLFLARLNRQSRPEKQDAPA